MPRFPRVIVPGCPHHVTQRGNVRREVFYGSGDHRVYLGLLKQYSMLYSLRILGYCLMTNHVHLVVIPEDEQSLAKVLREVHGSYARYRNALEHSTGHVWQNRYYSCAFEAIRLGSVMRYVELNPVRAGIVRTADEYIWSSAPTHLGGEDSLEILDRETWEREWPAADWAGVLHEEAEDATAIREATHRGRPLGSKAFVAALEYQLDRKLTPGKAGRPRKERVLVAG